MAKVWRLEMSQLGAKSMQSSPESDNCNTFILLGNNKSLGTIEECFVA